MKAVFSRQFMLSAAQKDEAVRQLRAAFAAHQAQRRPISGADKSRAGRRLKWRYFFSTISTGFVTWKCSTVRAGICAGPPSRAEHQRGPAGAAGRGANRDPLAAAGDRADRHAHAGRDRDRSRRPSSSPDLASLTASAVVTGTR